MISWVVCVQMFPTFAVGEEILGGWLRREASTGLERRGEDHQAGRCNKSLVLIMWILAFGGRYFIFLPHLLVLRADSWLYA